MITRIHVNQHIIKANRKSNTRFSPITVKSYKGTRNATRVAIDGPCTIIYSPDKPLACGAHVWIETRSVVR